jgi:hypothetical protein
MAMSDPPEENNPGRYVVEDMAVIRPDGTELVKLGDGFGPEDSNFLDLTPGDSVIVAAYDTDAGDALMIEVVGSTAINRIAAESLDRLLGSALVIN